MKTKLSFLAAAALLAFITGSALALTVPVAQDTSSSAKGLLTSKSGEATSLTVSDDQTALLEFDLSSTEVVPATFNPADVKSVLLELYVIKTNMAANLKVFAVAGTWSETFAAKTEPLPAIGSTVLATIPVPKAPDKQFVSVDITAAAVAALQSGSNLSVAIETTTAFAKVILGSKDGPATGYSAMLDIETDNGQLGGMGTAIGFEALQKDIPANNNGNSAFGYQALTANTFGQANVAVGYQALLSNTGGVLNVAVGYQALDGNTNGQSNVGIGYSALYHDTVGWQNIALGTYAGYFITTGSNDIEIGDDNVFTGANDESSGAESNTIRIGEKNTQKQAFIAGIWETSEPSVSGSAPLPVSINGNGQLGIASSSRRFKKDINDMGDASDVLLSLRPVTFHYKPGLDPSGKVPQFGLIAEEVEKVCPALVALDAKGEPFTVRYDAVNAMLLNEVLKDHRRVEAQRRTDAELVKRIAVQQGTIAAQQKRIQALTASMEKMTRQMDAVAQRLDGKDYQPVANPMGSVPNE